MVKENWMNAKKIPQLKKYYDQILEEEEKARDTIENALNEKYVKNNIIYNN